MRGSGPRVVIEDAAAPRLEPPSLAAEPVLDPAPRAGGAGLALAGIAVLAVGLAALQTANFVAAQFDRAAWLGWVTLAVAAAGFGLLFAAVARELRGAVSAWARVDRLRAALGSGEAGPHPCRRPAPGLPRCPKRACWCRRSTPPTIPGRPSWRCCAPGPAAAMRARAGRAWPDGPRSRWRPALRPPRRRRWRCCWWAWRGVRLVRQVGGAAWDAAGAYSARWTCCGAACSRRGLVGRV